MSRFAVSAPGVKRLYLPDQMIEVHKSDCSSRVYNHLMCFDPSRNLTRCYFLFEELLSIHSMQIVPQVPTGHLMHLYTCKKEQWESPSVHGMGDHMFSFHTDESIQKRLQKTLKCYIASFYSIDLTYWNQS